MVIVYDTLSECALQMYEVLLKYLWRLSNYRADTILWQTDKQTDGRKGKTMSPDPSSGGDIIIRIYIF